MEFLQYEFFQRALLTGIAVGMVTATLGVFVVLRKMSFFTDAVAHSSLVGIALGLLTGIRPVSGAILISLLVAIGVIYVNKRGILAIDTIIGVFFASSVALGVLLISFLPGFQVDLFRFLFGDILGVDNFDLILSLVLGSGVVALVLFYFRTLAKVAFNPDLAHVEGINVVFFDYLFMAVLALTIAVGLKIVGVLLVGPLIIIPAAAAQNFSANLRQMFILAIMFGVASVVIGLIGSYYLNTASGPTVVLTSALIFAASLIRRTIFRS